MNRRQVEGMVFNILRFSTMDGPGIRTTVFLKGCNLNCRWCHNPESIDGQKLLRFFRRKCTICGECAAVCPADAVRIKAGERIYLPDRCTLCGECAAACPEKAIEITGKLYGLDELFSELMKDAEFYAESGGGVTFSGGEPLLQTGFLKEMLVRLKDSGINTAVDTALNVSRNRITEVLPWTDLWLVDLKGMDAEAHLENTGADNKLLLGNVRWLSEQDVEMIIRMPLVKGLNDSEAELSAAAGLMENLPGLLGVEILPYHSLGVEKTGEYEAIAEQAEYEPPDEISISAAREIFASAGIRLL